VTGPYLTLAEAGKYCGNRSVKWVRRHLLPNIKHIHPPSAGILLDRESIDNFMQRFVVEPLNVDDIVREVLHHERRSRNA